MLISVSCIKPDQDNKNRNNAGNNLSDVNLDGHLIASWLFNGHNTVARDNSGNDLNGTIYGNPVKNESFTSSFTFDGKDDYISIPDKDSPPPEIISKLDKGSISLWFKVDSIPKDDGIMPIFYYGSRDNCLNMFDASNQGLVIEVGHSPVHYQSSRLYFTLFMKGCRLPTLCYDSNFNLEERIWYHFVAVVGEDYNTGYFNGKEMTKRYYNFGYPTSSDFFADSKAHEALYIGKGYWNQRTVFFKGQINDIRIYDKDINSAEARFLFNQGTFGPEPF